MMQPSVERAALNRQSSRKEQLTFISKLLRQTDMAFGEVVDAAKAVALLQTVFTKYTLDYKQMLILLHVRASPHPSPSRRQSDCSPNIPRSVLSAVLGDLWCVVSSSHHAYKWTGA
jgi:hypothetical protein